MPFQKHLPRSACASCSYRTLRLFCNLSDDALETFDQLGVQVEFPRGSTLFREGDHPSRVLVMCSGQVKLSCTSRGGNTLILKIAMPGDVLGLGAVMAATPYEVTAETILPCRVKLIPTADFHRFLKAHAQAAVHAARAMTEEYKAAFVDARRLALSTSAGARLASVLLEWSRAARCDGGDAAFPMPLTHEELGNIIGSSRETVTRTLNRFRKDGLVLVDGPEMRILDAPALEELSE